MFSAAATGLVAALAATVPTLLRERFPWIPANPALAVAFATATAALLAWFGANRGERGDFRGIGELFCHVHSPASPDSALRWALKAASSFAFCLAGAPVGAEGAAAEGAHSVAQKLRARSSRWFEQRRRTDASSALAAAVSASFGSPLAGIAFPLELSLGGRGLAVAVSSVIAFIASRALLGGTFVRVPGLGGIETARAAGLAAEDLTALAAASLAAAAFGVLSAWACRAAAEGVAGTVGRHPVVRALMAGALLALLALAYRGGTPQPDRLLDLAALPGSTADRLALFLLAGTLSLLLVGGGLASAGVVWPAFALGSVVGALACSALSPSAAGAGALLGGAVFLGVFFGAPLTGSLLAYGLSAEGAGSIALLVLALAAAAGMNALRRKLGFRTFIDRDLESQGIPLVDGRSTSVLDSVFVWEAMVTDHETVQENEPVRELEGRLLKSRYPFLPVVNRNGGFVGLLTADMIQEYRRSKDASSLMTRLLEAKDLVYRTGHKIPVLKINDRLSSSGGLFENLPCVPVANDDGRVVGLLFAHHVRLAYDREVAKRSLAFQPIESA